MTTLAKPQVICTTKMPQVGIDFHRDILASMTTPELFALATQYRRRTPTISAWRSVVTVLVRTGTDLSGPEIALVTGATSHSTIFTQLRNSKPFAEWGEYARALYVQWMSACELRRWPHESPVEDWRWVRAWEDMKK